jgi:hypothetical protein
MGTLKLLQGSSITCVSSGGSVSSTACAIANGASNFTNSTGLNFTINFRLEAACGSAPTQGATVSLYLVPKLDGSNAAGVDTSTPYINANYFAGNFAWPAASSASSQYMDITGIQVSAYDYAPYIINNLGQTISSGWTLTAYPDQAQY